MRRNDTNNLTLRFEALRPRLKAWAARMLGSEDDADDALQEAFFRLWRTNQDKDEPSGAIDSHSITAVRSACIDSLRRRKVRLAEPLEQAEMKAFDSEAEHRADLAEEVKDLIDHTLDPRAREILMLHDSLDYDYDEIAARLDITEAHCRVILSRARKAIRDAYRRRNNI